MTSLNGNIELVVFDLDGTLCMSHKTIYQAVIKTLADLEIDVKIDENEFYKTIGMHFREIFAKLNVEVEDLEFFISEFIKRYFDFIEYTELYEGVLETLEDLHSRGFKIALLTTKAQGQAEQIIEHFKIGKYFSGIYGRRPDLEVKPSPQPLLTICSDLKIAPENTLMVGDSEMDIQCGKNAGAKSCAVTFGYRTKEKLKSEQPDLLIDKMIALNSLIKN